MKYFFIIIFFPLPLLSQKEIKDSVVKIKAKKVYTSTDSFAFIKEKVIVSIPDVMPEYLGGYKKMMEFIENNIVRPVSCPKGNVYTAFTIDKIGQVVNPRIILGINKSCDKAALDVLKKLPKFKPAKDGSNVIDYEIKLPIKFK